MPRLKSFELVSSISTKFDDQIPRLKVLEGFHTDKKNTIELKHKKVHLKKLEKNHKFDMENEDKWHMGIKNGGLSENSSPLKYASKNAIHESTSKLRSSSAPQRMELSMSKEERNTIDDFDLDTFKKEELNAIGTYRSKGIKSVKEDCERFRLQMKILKEKADDSRFREVMVEGMVENLHKNINEETIKENTIVDHNALQKNDEREQKSISNHKNFFTNNLSIEGKIITEIDDVDTKHNQHKKTSLYTSSMMHRRSKPSSPYNTSNFERKNNCQNNAHEDFKTRKRIKTYNNFSAYSNTSSSSTSSTTSSLSSLPLSHYIQKLKCLAPISRCLSNSSTSINKNIITNDNLTQTPPINTTSEIDIALNDCQNVVQDPHSYKSSPITDCEKIIKALDSDKSNMQVDIETENHINNKLTNSNNIPIPRSTLNSELNTHFGIFACQRTRNPCIAPIRNNNMTNHGEKTNKKVGKIMLTNQCISPYENKCSNEKDLDPYNTIDGVILQQSNNINEAS